MTAVGSNLFAAFSIHKWRLKSPLQIKPDELWLKFKIVATVLQQFSFDSLAVGANSFARIRLNLIHATR